MLGKRTWVQIIMLAIVVAALAWLANNLAGNLERTNVASGFGFLDERAGFGVSQSLIAYTEDSSYGKVLLVGLGNTLVVSLAGIVLASLLGFTLGVARLSHNWIIAKLAAAYIEVFRNVPLLLQIMFWYFGVLRNLPSPRQSFALGDVSFLNNRGLFMPTLTSETGAGFYGAALVLVLAAAYGLWAWRRRVFLKTGNLPRLWTPLLGITVLAFASAYIMAGLPFAWDIPSLRGFNFGGGIHIIPEFVALLLALTLYTAAFIAEIVRAGIVAVPRGQSEASFALGLPYALVLRRIIIPQALRVIIPPLTSQYLNLTKNSSLAVAIAYPDVVSVFAGTALTQIGQAVEIIFITMMVYLSLSLFTAWIMNRYNAHSSLVGHHG